MSAPGLTFEIALEPDALHRETQPLILERGYTALGQLDHLSLRGPGSAKDGQLYRYDALGRRISKTVRHANGTIATTHYGWDGDRLVHEAKENQRTTVVYEPGSFVPMLRIDQAGHDAPKQISAYITDALGTPMQLVTPKGETLWQAQPDDWMAVKNERGTAAQLIRFQGQWHDEESGLYYNRHRYYDPQQGRYISQDPIGLKGGRNLYGYVSNPTGMVDPLGLEGEHIFWRAIKDVPRMFGQYAEDMLIPEKETAEAVSDVAAVCSLSPPLTLGCGTVSITAGLYAAGTEARAGDYIQSTVDAMPIAASATTDFLTRRAGVVSDAISHGAGVVAGFKTQYWTRKDNLGGGDE
ncbi:RHS domain-containing protein [Halomonas sp. ML-15]|uniref:RHS repeat-associated core domain-containing protein n=1 Tax=Halomonas sp. ML-15 TaxID=2773305 RepID=UPI001745F021|nr:RHS repeat-associated core domain-containing protein [Halomonas sp. ML-15]MBD3896816.1 RHS domain-containing protein [Halomonas sp. ML-15]